MSSTLAMSSLFLHADCSYVSYLFLRSENILKSWIKQYFRDTMKLICIFPHLSISSVVQLNIFYH